MILEPGLGPLALAKGLGQSFLRPLASLWGQASPHLALSCLCRFRVRMGTEVQPPGAKHVCPEGLARCPSVRRNSAATWTDSFAP